MKAVATVLAFAILPTFPAEAAPGCIDPYDRAVLRTSTLRSQLMIAALHCKALEEPYRRFLQKFATDLSANDAAAKQALARLNTNFDSWHTQMVGLAGHKTIEPAFCDRERALYDQLLSPGTASLAGFVPPYDLLSEVMLPSCPAMR